MLELKLQLGEMKCWRFLGATSGVLIWPKMRRTLDWVSRCERVTRCDAKELTLTFPSRRRQRVRKSSQGGVWLEAGGRSRKASEPLHAQTARRVQRCEETQLTFPPRKTWYQTEVPPKSMWKSVKQPFTLIRQYLQHRGGEAEKQFNA